MEFLRVSKINLTWNPDTIRRDIIYFSVAVNEMGRADIALKLKLEKSPESSVKRENSTYGARNVAGNGTVFVNGNDTILVDGNDTILVNDNDTIFVNDNDTKFVNDNIFVGLTAGIFVFFAFVCASVNRYRSCMLNAKLEPQVTPKGDPQTNQMGTDAGGDVGSSQMG